VARAKRTERAAARRRHRAAELESQDTETAEATPRGVVAQSRATPNTTETATAVRVGIASALRASFHPVQFREDLVALPTLVRHRSLWLPVLLTVATAVATAVTGGSDVVTALLFTYFVVTPAIGGVFLAGFLAPRASWLLGVIVSLVAAVCYIAMGYAGRLPAPFNEQFTTAASAAVLSSLLIAPVVGALFASMAAWYRRFLTLTNPNRGRRPQQPQKRVGDGRTRAAPPKPNAKAAARR
jgi:hypothetical protein